MKDIVLTDANFKKEIDESKGYAMVDFWAPWCGPCQAMIPILEELKKEYENKLKIAKLNVDQNPNISKKFNILSIPSFIFFKDGKEINRLVGAHDRETMIDKIDEIIK